MTQNTQNDTNGTLGNTIESLKNIRCRRYCLTWNNYTDDDYNYTNNYCEKKCIKFIIGKEVGTNNTKHLQIYMRFKNPISFTSIKKNFPKCHIEKAKGTDEQNYNYCKKENEYNSNMDDFQTTLSKITLEEEYKDIKWKTWQEAILTIIKQKPHNRHIYWFYDKNGNTGKTFIAKYICLKNNNVIIGDGKKNDVYYQIAKMIEMKIIPRIIILDIPRYSQNWINYGVIETIKNGMIFSGKYESIKCIFPIPHVIIFSNEKPDITMWSIDRLKLVEIV